MSCHWYSSGSSPASDIPLMLVHKGIRKMHKREFIPMNYERTCRHNVIQILETESDQTESAGSDFPSSLGYPSKNFPQFLRQSLLNFQHDFLRSVAWPVLHWVFCTIASSSLKSPWTTGMTFCIMAWVTFALSLLHICVGFILPLRALRVLCSQWLWKTKAANSLLLPLWWSPQQLPGGARCSRAGFAPGLLSP